MQRNVKKGAIEVQLNWIFVLIAGALILLFFVGVVIRQRGVSEREISYNILTKLKSITSTVGVTADAADFIDIPETEINWDCPSNSLTIEGVSIPIPAQIFFAPDKIKGRKLITWTQEWRVPFFVSNFLFITTPEVRYILVYSEDPRVMGKAIKDAKSINKTLPGDMSVEIKSKTEFTTLQDKNNYAVKVILLGFSDKNDVEDLLENSDLKNIVAGVQYDDTTAEIFFYEAPDFSQEETKYIPSYKLTKKDPSYYAAIFADTKESYDCMMKTAFKRLEKIRNIYGIRAERFESESRKECWNYYLTEKNVLGFTSSKISKLISNIGEDCSEEFPSGTNCNVDHISDYARGIFEVNEALIRRSCPLVY